MLDKSLLVGVMIAAGGAVGQVVSEADAAAGSIPGLTPISQLTAIGAVIYLVVLMTTRTIPQMNERNAAKDEKVAAENAALVKGLVKDFRDEMALNRADREKDRT